MNEQLKGAGMSFMNGVMFGSGFLIAVILFKTLFHFGLCG
jgi:hypothetical protein